MYYAKRYSCNINHYLHIPFQQVPFLNFMQFHPWKPFFDCLQFITYYKQSKTGGLGTSNPLKWPVSCDILLCILNHAHPGWKKNLVDSSVGPAHNTELWCEAIVPEANSAKGMFWGCEDCISEALALTWRCVQSPSTPTDNKFKVQTKLMWPLWPQECNHPQLSFLLADRVTYFTVFPGKF